VGRLFREFAVVLSVAIAVSLVVSLTTTAMMCAILLRPVHAADHGRLYRLMEWLLETTVRLYGWTLRWVLQHPRKVVVVNFLTIAFTVYLYGIVPRGFFPQQDTGRLMGQVMADQDTSSQTMRRLLTEFANGVLEDKAVDSVIGFSGGQGNASNN